MYLGVLRYELKTLLLLLSGIIMQTTFFVNGRSLIIRTIKHDMLLSSIARRNVVIWGVCMYYISCKRNVSGLLDIS